MNPNQQQQIGHGANSSCGQQGCGICYGAGTTLSTSYGTGYATTQTTQKSAVWCIECQAYHPRHKYQELEEVVSRFDAFIKRMEPVIKSYEEMEKMKS